MRQQYAASFGGTAAAASDAECVSFFLLFRSLFHGRRAFEFACDPQGHVDMDGMSERERSNYLYARAMIGHEVGFPSVHSRVERIAIPGTGLSPAAEHASR